MTPADTVNRAGSFSQDFTILQKLCSSFKHNYMRNAWFAKLSINQTQMWVKLTENFPCDCLSVVSPDDFSSLPGIMSPHKR